MSDLTKKRYLQALDIIGFESWTDKRKLDGQPKLFIHIIPDKATNTVSIVDRGVGMTKADTNTEHKDMPFLTLMNILSNREKKVKVVEAKDARSSKVEGGKSQPWLKVGKVSRGVGNFELLLPLLLYYCWFKIDTAAKD
ncbi:heat shock protein 90-2 [Tanacetum coccineum]